MAARTRVSLAANAPYIIRIDDLLSSEECKQHLDFLKHQQLAQAKVISASGAQRYKPELRSHHIAEREDRELADVLTARIAPHAPEVIEGARFDAINPMWRYFLYEQGDYFGPHTDIGWRDDKRLTRMTLLVYLNDDFTGGTTRFHVSPELEIAPEPGMALLFQHAIIHEGLEITSGVKAVLRSEVFYRQDA